MFLFGLGPSIVCLSLCVIQRDFVWGFFGSGAGGQVAGGGGGLLGTKHLLGDDTRVCKHTHTHTLLVWPRLLQVQPGCRL